MQFQGESSDHSVSDTQKPIKVKISGNGTQMTRNSNYIILLFSILQKERRTYVIKRYLMVYFFCNSWAYDWTKVMKRHSDVKQITGQGVKKKYDDARRVLRHKSNNWDSSIRICVYQLMIALPQKML
ncbi:uncharacterized protein [Acropora muricata]|uniref:uncharacterized protein n=1 Tax=Acropora muricata TaxID=159855 RepID=UPI0034E3C5C4